MAGPQLYYVVAYEVGRDDSAYDALGCIFLFRVDDDFTCAVPGLGSLWLEAEREVVLLVYPYDASLLEPHLLHPSLGQRYDVG